MSRATVRTAMVSRFGGAGIVGLTGVFKAQKKTTSGDEFFAVAGDRSGCLAFVFIESEKESRRSVAGTSVGYKKISYEVALVLQFRHSGETEATSTEDAAWEAIDDFDTLVEGIKHFIRTDRTLGGAVFQIGEGDTKDGDDIEIQSDMPTLDNNGMVHIWAAVRFHVIEWTDPNS